MKKRGIGSTFDSFLEKEGIFDEVDALAQKRIIAWQIEQGAGCAEHQQGRHG
jgi:hypothetical protein